MARLSGCSDSDRAKLIPDTLSFHRSLSLSVSSPSISSPFRVLLDSGAELCFINTKFASRLRLPKTPVTPREVVFINGTTSVWVTEAVRLSIRLSAMDPTDVMFVITDLDPSCDVILGMNWLFQHNPLVDWITGQVTPRPSTIEENPLKSVLGGATASASHSVPLSISVSPTVSVPHTPVQTSSAVTPNQAQTPTLTLTPTPSSALTTPSTSVLTREPKVSFVNAAAFARACRLRGSQTFGMTLSSEMAQVASASYNAPDTTQQDLLSVPEEYRGYSDVFSKKKADTLAPHQPYDLKINLVEGAEPPPGVVYSLSQSELCKLREFLDEHLCIGFIHPSCSLHGAPVLFVRKKNSNLRLCVDFRGLNKVTKKDRYPLPLTKDLLDVPGKAKIYTKLNLRHAYHLVCIAKGDEWKTAFCTQYRSFKWCVMPLGSQMCLPHSNTS